MTIGQNPYQYFVTGTLVLVFILKNKAKVVNYINSIKFININFQKKILPALFV